MNANPHFQTTHGRKLEVAYDPGKDELWICRRKANLSTLPLKTCPTCLAGGAGTVRCDRWVRA